jgi:hypothetical protein
VCAIDGDCGTSAIATTDSDGIAQFRYWLPGLVTADTSYPNPIEDLSFSARAAPSCGCWFGAQGTATVGITLTPRIWVNRTETITPAEIAGLNAIIADNAASDKVEKQRAMDILQVMKAAGVLTKDDIKDLTGIADLGLDKALQQLMGKDPDSVLMAWFMNKFRIASDGLLEGNFDPNAFARELKPYLINFLTAKILKVKALKKVEKQIRTLLSTGIDKLTHTSFTENALDVVHQIIKRSTTGKPSQGHATVKLLDISTCGGSQCLALPLPQADEQLFMIVSETNKTIPENYFYPSGSYSSEAPIAVAADRWIRAQCSAAFGCDTANK